jgi:hypothetical protein
MYEILKRTRNKQEELIRDESIGIVNTKQQAIDLSDKLGKLESIRKEKRKNDTNNIYYLFRELSPMTDEMFEQYVTRLDRDIKAES